MVKHAMWTVAMLASAAGQAAADHVIPFLPGDQLPKNVTLHAADKLLPKQPVVEVQPGAEAATKVLETEQPNAPAPQYVLKGKVKYDNVAPAGYVEMWSHFADGNAYFSRTLADQAGPLAKLDGTNDWREIALPFFSKPGMLPEKLVVNVVIPGKGTVYLGELTISELQGAGLSAGGAWWSEQAGIWVGALGGAGLGILGAIIGTLCGVGVGRQLCVALALAVIGFCGLCLVAGIAALVMDQPYHVYYPLLLGGGIGLFVFGFNLPTIRRRFEAIERRRMSALDA